MATGLKSNLVIYDPRTKGGFVEKLTENVDAFNAASGGTVRFVSNQREGDFNYESMFKDISSLITRRDTGSVAAVADTPMTQDQFIGVKLNRKIGPVAQTLDSFRKAGIEIDENNFHYSVGQQAAIGAAKDYLTSALRATRAALGAHAATSVHNITGATTKTMHTKALINSLSKYGDAASRVKAWIMHSTPFWELVGDQYDYKITGVSDLIVATASPLTLNRPVLVIDNAALKLADGGGAGLDWYYTMGLVDDAVIVEDTEEEQIATEIELGKENIIMRMQGEFAYNVSVKACKWDVANGGENPNDTALGTSTNWDAVLASHKDFAGVMCISQTAA